MKSNSSNNSSFISALATLTGPYRHSLAFGLTAAALASAFDVLGPMLLRSGVNALQEARPIGWLYGFAGMIIIVAFISGVFRYLMRRVVIGTSRWVESDLRENYFSHLLSLAPLFFDKSLTGDLMARSTDDMERVRMVLGPALQFSVSTSLTLIFSAMMMFYLDSGLALLVMVLAPIIGGVVLFMASKMHRVNFRQQQVYGRLEAQVQENLAGIRVIKSFVREQHESARFTDICRLYFKRSMVVARIQALFMPVLTMLIGCGVAGILWVGGQRVVAGIIGLGDFIAFISYLSLMTWPMIALGWMTHMYQRGKASYKRLEDIFTIERQFADEDDSGNGHGGDTKDYFDDVHNEAPSITFNNIHFRYGEDNPCVFDDLNLEICSGSILAVVGRTGSGKSTLLRILSRLYEPQRGSVLFEGCPPLTPPPQSGGGIDCNSPPETSGGIDCNSPPETSGGIDCNPPTEASGGISRFNPTPLSGGGIKGGGVSWNELPISQLRRMIGYVDQTPFLFSATLRENIAFGKPNASDEEIERAAQLACFDHDIADFPDGYETRIGERGVTLSGGQQQRLTLARALVMDPPILVLDDALSAVDTQTEAGIIDNFQVGLSGRTVILVTHRLAAAERADSIAVLEGGRVAEFGTHQELMKFNGIYAAMYRRQRLTEELGAMS